jgi:uncharacterized membrane protein HdeD (DUF308 family)/3',5'-cyclic AMP phosphodiesterase CpdA
LWDRFREIVGVYLIFMELPAPAIGTSGESASRSTRISGVLVRRVAGALLLTLGVLALTAPLATGRWSLAFLGICLIVLGLIEAYAAFTSPKRSHASAYLPSVLAVLAGNVLLLSASLVLSGLLVLLIVILVIDGLGKILTGLRSARAVRLPSLISGLLDLAGAALLWYLNRKIGTGQAIGIIVGGLIAAAGWRLLMTPSDEAAGDEIAAEPNAHPDADLHLASDEAFGRLRAEVLDTRKIVRGADLMWMSTLVLIFLAIHLGRMPRSASLLGMGSPFAATGGDLVMTVTLAVAVVLPARLLWRRATRPLERLAWSLHLGARAGNTPMNRTADWLIGRWLASRFGFSMRLREAQATLASTLLLLLRLGLPLTAFVVAFNPIWGFTWYLNTESWVTGIYQKLTELRVDPWRVGMIDAVTRAFAGGDELFQIHPDGVAGPGDFSFVVIGDPGEGDASQYALISRYLELGHREDVKFLVVASDVIYPAGAMEDYESNFYLAFQGFAKPIYAVPGNHDWFDALEGFNANFLEPKAARAAIEGRVEADLGLTATNIDRVEKLLTRAARLRDLYQVGVGTQRTPFFELQTSDFVLLGVDTGILRTVDARQWAWLERALSRSRGKFVMAIVGHPRIAGGHDIPPTAEGHDVADTAGKFAALYRLLASHDVRIAMAGDTHDFEYYREIMDGGRVMHHFVNGGGGAYLSIGTALDFPNPPATADWAFYPRTDRLRAKLDVETPVWKQPFWYWIKWLDAWPFSIEALSGIFDFNHAPFFLSFMEVRVERSKRQVVLVLNGIHGPLRWSDLQTGGAVVPSGAIADDPVEFVIRMDGE